MASAIAAVEGDLDEYVLRVICDFSNVGVLAVYRTGGSGQMDLRLRGYNAAAARQNWIVLRDLDYDAGCAVELRGRLLPLPAPGMTFRIAVRAVEAWLMADRDRYSAFMGIDSGVVPTDPDNVPDPKSRLIEHARGSRKTEIRNGIVPRLGSGARTGPGYTSQLASFARQDWRPAIALKSSQSLQRAVRAIRNISGDAPKSVQ